MESCLAAEVQLRYVGKRYQNVENYGAEPTLEDYYIFTGSCMDKREE